MFLKIPGVTGETNDPAHKGEIEVLSWNWGAHAAAYRNAGGSDINFGTSSDVAVTGRAALRTLEFTKRVDRSTPNLLQYLDTNKNIDKATLTVRKASGGSPFEYLAVNLTNARIVFYDVTSTGPELIERVSVAFMTIELTYTPQGSLGNAGGGTVGYATQNRGT
jgi:type VI secretion system secreted protein Hcp